MVGGAEGAQRRGSSGERARAPYDVGSVAGGRECSLGFGAEQPAGVGELQPAAGAHEERDAELGLEVGDLLGDARASEVQRVRGGGEGTVLGRGEKVGELLQGHEGLRRRLMPTAGAVNRALAPERTSLDTGPHEPRSTTA